MKVVLLTSGLMYGGGQRVVLDLLEHARSKEGTENVCLMLLGCREPAIEHKAVAVVPYDGQYNRVRTLVETARLLRRTLRSDPPAILHTHGWDADIIGWLAILGTSTRQIIHLHITPDWLRLPSIKHRLRRTLTRRAFLRTATQLVAVSDAVRQYWSELLPWNYKAIRVIRNGIDVSRFQPAEGSRYGNVETPVIGVAARLAPMKGIEYLLDALGILAREDIAFRLEVAGKGGYREILERRAREAGILEQTFFLGHIEDMPAFYHSIDIYVLPSVSTEGLPLSILEAMAMGLPIVATAVAGTPEAVRDGRDGLLVVRRDVESLAKALRQLLGDEVLRRRMGNSARQRAVDKFPLERFASEVFDLYRAMARGVCS